jgi:hypothetical protein
MIRPRSHKAGKAESLFGDILKPFFDSIGTSATSLASQIRWLLGAKPKSDTQAFRTVVDPNQTPA